MTAAGWPRCTACRQGSCQICTAGSCACWCEGKKRRSVHCAVGAHDRCQDGAAIACPCSCHKESTTASTTSPAPPTQRDGVVDGGVGSVFGEVGGPGVSNSPEMAQARGEAQACAGSARLIGPEPSITMCDARLPDPVAELVAFLQQEADRVKAHATSNTQSDWWDGYAFGMDQAASAVASLAKRQAERELDFAEGRF